MASTQTNIRRDPSFSVLKFVLDGATTQTGVVSLKGVKNAWLVCDTGTPSPSSKAFLPSVDETMDEVLIGGESQVPPVYVESATYGDLTVPASNLAYAEITGVDTVGGGTDVERQGVPCVGTNANPLYIPEHSMPTYAYFTMPATSTAYLYLAY